MCGLQIWPNYTNYIFFDALHPLKARSLGMRKFTSTWSFFQGGDNRVFLKHSLKLNIWIQYLIFKINFIFSFLLINAIEIQIFIKQTMIDCNGVGYKLPLWFYYYFNYSYERRIQLKPYQSPQHREPENIQALPIFLTLFGRKLSAAHLTLNVLLW